LTKAARVDKTQEGGHFSRGGLFMKCLRSAVFLTLLGIACGIAAAALSGRQQGREIPPLTIQPLTGALLLAKGGSGANAGIFVGQRELIVIDAKMSPESVEAMLAEIKKTVPFPVTKIILTHSDADHINGLPGFPKGLEIISQENVKEEMVKAAADLPALQDYLPTVVFKDEMKIKSGRVTITLAHYGPAHTNGDAVVYFDKDRTAFVGDLVFIGRDPLIHLSKGGSAFGLVRTLKEILGHRPHVEMFIPGHGGIVTREEVEMLRDSIETKQSKIKALIADGKSLEEIKKILGVEDVRPGAEESRSPGLVEIIYRELAEKK
jgi:cyclase